MSDPIIKIENMNKWFGDFQVLKNIDLSVEKNKKIVVCGPSGSGKSTLIRCINRLEEHQEGTIIVDGNELSENTKNIEKIIGPLFGRMKSGKKIIYHKYVHDYMSLSKILKSLQFRNIKKFNWKNTFHSKFDDHSQAYFPHMKKNNGIMISLNIDAKK